MRLFKKHNKKLRVTVTGYSTHTQDEYEHNLGTEEIGHFTITRQIAYDIKKSLIKHLDIKAMQSIETMTDYINSFDATIISIVEE